MDKLDELQATVDKLAKKIKDLTINEKRFLDLFLQIEHCQSFEELQELSMAIGNNSAIPKCESMLYALAARIRQNSISIETVDAAVYELQKDLEYNDETIFH